MEFYRGKIPHGKISVKILRQIFHVLNSKKSLQNQLKIAAKSRQDRRKILCIARKRKERESIAKIYGEISPPKARSKPAKRVPKIKKSPQNPRDKIPPANFSG